LPGKILTGDGSATTNSSLSGVLNFGQDSSFAGTKTAQGNQDGNDKGDFYYAPPAGFKALCTDNLPAPSITLPTDHFETVLWTGDGADTKAIAASNFVMDFTWIKNRDGAANNYVLYDRIRGTGIRLVSNSTQGNADLTSYGNEVEFTAPGINVGSTNAGYEEEVNKSGVNYVGWNWKANGSGSANTDGSINSTVSANTTAGFSIVKYTGQSAAGTIGHGLSQAPEFIMLKNTTTGVNYFWSGYNTGSGNTKSLPINDSGAAYSEVTWNNTTPTASVFSIGAQSETSSHRFNYTGEVFIAYCFHSVEGYSKVGSYLGNGSADGPFIYTGFRPSWFLWKNSTAGGSWWGIIDNKRLGYNVDNNPLYANVNDAAYTTDVADIVSNGIKIRHDLGNINQSGQTIIYLAFAESPFKTSNAR
jgi:hypothetical protein